MEGPRHSRDPEGQWEEPDREWNARLRHLQECVCELLIKNQQLRMALATKPNEQGTVAV
jgi:hypothetical protein